MPDKDIEHLLLDAMGKTEGVSVDVTLLRAKAPSKPRKPRKEKPKREIIETGGPIGWGDVIDPLPQMKHNIDKWSGVDFRLFVGQLYKAKFTVWPDMPIRRTYAFFNKLRVIIGRTMKHPLQECDNQTFKDFIQFYFERYAAESTSKYKGWRVEWLNSSDAIADFLSSRKRVAEALTHIPAIPVPPKAIQPAVAAVAVSMDPKVISDTTKLGDRALMLSYGLVITANYRLRGKSKEEMSAILRSICAVAADAVKKNPKYWVNIQRATEKYGPYPITLLFVDIPKMAARIHAFSGISLSPIHVSFVDDERIGEHFHFLR